MARGQGDRVLERNYFQERNQEFCWQSLKCLFFTHRSNRSLCAFAIPLKRSPLQEKEKVPRSAAELQGDSTAGDEVQGTKLLFQHGRSDKVGNVLSSPSPAPWSHHFTVVPCLFNSASCLWTPPETCHSLNMLSILCSCVQELPPKPQPAAELIALARVEGRLRRDAAALQTGEHMAHVQNHSKCLLRPQPQANSFCLWWECLHFLPLNAFWHIKGMAGTEIPWDPLVLFLWMLVPWIYLKKNDSFNSLSLWVCVSLPIVRRRVLFAIMDWLGLILG